MERRDFLKGMAIASALSAETLYGAQANRPAPQLLAQDDAPSRPPDDPWPGKKRSLAIADPEEWYASPGCHQSFRRRSPCYGRRIQIISLRRNGCNPI